MALKIADRIKQITTTPPLTNPFALATTPATFFAFSSFLSIGDTVYYEADDGSSNVEVGLGTYTAANQLTRTTIYKSSNANSPCNFTNNVTVICTAPASRLALLTAAGIMPVVDGSALTGIVAAQIGGLGQAALKAVSDNARTTLAAVFSATAGNIVTFQASNGTIQDSGFAPSYFAPATLVSSSAGPGATNAPFGTIWIYAP